MTADVLGSQDESGSTLFPANEPRQAPAASGSDGEMKGPEKNRLLSNVSFEILMRDAALLSRRSFWLPVGPHRDSLLLAVTFPQPAPSNIYPLRVGFSGRLAHGLAALLRVATGDEAPPMGVGLSPRRPRAG